MNTSNDLPPDRAGPEGELIRALVDSMQDMVFTTDAEGRFTGVYGQAFEQAGLREEDFLGRTPAEVNGDESREMHERAIATLQRGEPIRYEWTQQDKVFQTSATPQFDQGGRVVGMVAVRSDVTQLHRRDREARAHRRALEAAANGIVITDANSVITWANRAIQDLTGYEPAELIGKNPRILKSGEQPEAYYRDLWETISGGDVWRGNIINRRKDGSLYTEEMTVTPVTDAHGRVDQYVAIKQDVTEKMKALHDLETSRAWWKAILEQGAELVTVSDPDGTFTYVSPSSNRILGFDPDALIGSNAYERIHPEDLGRARVALETVARGESVDPVELRFRHNDGSWRVLEAQGSNALDEPAVGGIIINAWDVTERVSIQVALDEQRMLVDIAGEVARLGGWSVDLEEGTVSWSDMVCDIHDEPRGTRPEVEQGIQYYAPEYRDEIRDLWNRAVSEGAPYDREMQIITARGRRVWVRATGSPVTDTEGRVVAVRGAFQDIDVRKKAEKRAAELDLQLHTTLDSVTDAFVTVDASWHVSFANRAARSLSDLAASAIVGAPVWDVFPRILGDSPRETLRQASSERTTLRTVTFDHGLRRWFDVRSDPVHDGVAIVLRDVTARQEMLEHLRIQEARLASSLRNQQALVNSLPAHVAVLDSDGTILEVNEQWRTFGRENGLRFPASGVGHNYLNICDSATGSGAADATAVAKGIRTVLSGDAAAFEREYACHSPAHKRWSRVAVNAKLLDGSAQSGAVVMHVDITERKQAEMAISRLAYEDQLTGSLTRNGFVRALEEHIEAFGWLRAGIIASMDLNDFRDINDAHGYDVGDHILIAVANRLSEVVGEHGLVGRTGGDSFVIYLANAPGSSTVAPDRALETLFAEPFSLEDFELRTTARFGVTVLSDEQRSVEELIREADVALYAGAAARNGHVFAYSAELDRASRARSDLIQELRSAVENDQFTLHMQPKVDLETGLLVAGEALIRWQHPTRGLVSPGVFIPAAEQSDLIVPIGNWVLREACHALRKWQDEGLDIVRIAVNVSAEQFMTGVFPQDVRKALSDFGVDPAGLTLEITESVFVRESAKLQKDLVELHEMGVRLALDDFGKGFSSLSYLSHYAFDEIKIDRTFIQDIRESAFSQTIVDAVVRIASTLGAETIAEGVESKEQADRLRELGCRIGQGYYYSVPLDMEDFRWLLERRSPLPLKTTR